MGNVALSPTATLWPSTENKASEAGRYGGAIRPDTSRRQALGPPTSLSRLGLIDERLLQGHYTGLNHGTLYSGMLLYRIPWLNTLHLSVDDNR